jgi:hypothetical protein
MNQAVLEVTTAPIYPFECPLCLTPIQSADDRTEWHGLGNCANVCELCWGDGEIETPPMRDRGIKKPEMAQCPNCLGTGIEKGAAA